MTSSTVPFIDLPRQHDQIRNEIEERVLAVLRSGRYIGGPEVEGFEDEFARYCDVSEAVAVNSGTAALHTALLALGIGRGDEVITVANSFIATVEAIVAVGATPVFVDIDPLTHTMEPRYVEAAITTRTKAIIPVHLYGQTVDMDPILQTARSHGLAVVEDACQAHGATYGRHPAGSLGDVACFSFYPSKNLGADGEGGIAITNTPELANRMRAIRDHGQSRRYMHDVFGLNFRLPAIQAAILRAKLPHLDDWNDRRRQHAASYTRSLQGLAVDPPYELNCCRHVYHLYVIRSDDRDGLQAHLREQGIETGIHYPVPLHLQPPYVQYGGGRGSLPETERAADTILSLPIYPELTQRHLKRVVAAIRSFGQARRKPATAAAAAR